MATIPFLLDEMGYASIRTRTDLGWLARHMKGSITPGKRGKGGTATTRDAARLLIAAMSTAPAPQVKEAVERIGCKTIKHAVRFAYCLGPGDKPITYDIAPAGSSFEDALANLIDLRRHPDGQTAALAGNIERIGVREADGQEWPWIEPRKPLPGLDQRLYVNDGVLYRFVFGDLKEYAFGGRGLVRETVIGSRALYRVSAALGLAWQKLDEGSQP